MHAENKQPESTTIVKALELLERRLGERLDGIENMLRNVGERVGFLERAVAGTPAVAELCCDGGDR